MYTGKTLFAQLMDFLPWKPARQDKKKPQLITVGASVLVGWRLLNSAGKWLICADIPDAASGHIPPFIPPDGISPWV